MQNKLDRQIYEAMVAMGWIIPTTPEGVQIAEEALEGEECSPLPPALVDPSQLINRLKSTLSGDWEEVE